MHSPEPISDPLLTTTGGLNSRINAISNLRSIGEGRGVRKTYHHKVRSGCGTCKKRRVKCDEAKPECNKCIKADVKCDGYSAVPQPRIFIPSGSLITIITESKKRVSSSKKQCVKTWKSYTHQGTRQHQKKIEELNRGERTVGQTYFDKTRKVIPSVPSSTFANEEEFQAYKMTIKWMVHYGNERVYADFAYSDFWNSLVPQVAWQYEGVRYAMIGHGLIGTSLLRRDNSEKYQAEDLKSIHYITKAYRCLSTTKVPAVVVAIAALIFGQLDIGKGSMVSGTAHTKAASRIADQARLESSATDFTATLIERFENGLRRPVDTLSHKICIPGQTPDVRIRNALSYVKQGYRDICLAMERTKQCSHTRKLCEDIMDVLRQVQFELKWIYQKWQPVTVPMDNSYMDEFEALDVSKTERRSLENVSYSFSNDDRKPGLLYEDTLRDLYDYLEHEPGTFSMARFVPDITMQVPTLINIIRQGDLTIGQDFAELLEAESVWVRQQAKNGSNVRI